ncbi:MAG: hypothetical protein EXR79_10150 [Myxococcales bacterium]|nr:hypothetical protein [Myxococcales bacterium]
MDGAARAVRGLRRHRIRHARPDAGHRPVAGAGGCLSEPGLAQPDPGQLLGRTDDCGGRQPFSDVSSDRRGNDGRRLHVVGQGRQAPATPARARRAMSLPMLILLRGVAWPWVLIPWGTVALGMIAPLQVAAQPAPKPAEATAPKPAEATPPAPDTDTALEADQAEATGTALGEPVGVRVWHKDAAAAHSAVIAAVAEVQRVARKFDATNRLSEVWSINNAAGTDEVILSVEGHELVQRSLDLCRRCAGAVDLTVATFDSLWNFGGRPFVRPLPQEVATRRAKAGCTHVALKPNRIVRLLEPTLRVTLRDVLRGHAVEMAAEVVRKAGIDNMRIRFGASVYAQGRTGTRHWYTTVPMPRRPEATLAQLYLSSHYAATRTDSDRVAVKNGRRYHAVLDPRTGEPAAAGVQATVIATDPILADGLATAVFVLGPKAGLALVAQQKNVEAFVVDQSGKVHASAGMTEFARLPAKVPIEGL